MKSAKRKKSAELAVTAPDTAKGLRVNGNLVSEEFWQSIMSSGPSYTGRSVTDAVILETSSVYSAIRLIAEAVSSLPLHLYRRTSQGDVKATDHPLYFKLNKKPHRYSTRVSFIESLAVSMCVWNQGYIKPNFYNGPGSRVLSLQALPKPWVDPFFERRGGVTSKEVQYRVRENGRQVVYQFGEIIPVKGFGHAGDLEGVAVPYLHRNAIGLAMAAEEFGSRFFGNGARPGGILTYDKMLTHEQRERIRENMQEKFGGLENAQKLLILEAGMQFQAVQSANNDSQFIETRKLQIAEIARIFRVPLHKLYEMAELKYNTVESEERAFQIDTLSAYVERIELALDCFLLTPREQDGYFVKFNLEGRLRADLKTRSESYKSMILTGVLTPNEARAYENLPPLVGGDELLLPLNMAPASIHAAILEKGGATKPSKDDA